MKNIGLIFSKVIHKIKFNFRACEKKSVNSANLSFL